MKVRKDFEAANSRWRSLSMTMLTLSLAPIILIALREDNIFFVAEILFSVAASQTCCWIPMFLPT